MTGFQFFTKLNRNLQEIGLPVITDCPQQTNVQYFDFFSVDIYSTPGTEDINLNFSPVISAETKLKVFASRVINPGIKNFMSAFLK